MRNSILTLFLVCATSVSAADRKTVALTVIAQDEAGRASVAALEAQILRTLDAKKGSDAGLLAQVTAQGRCAALAADCVTDSIASTVPHLTEQLRANGVDAWILVIGGDSELFAGNVWIVGSNGGGGSAKLTYRYPKSQLDDAWHSLARDAGVMKDEDGARRQPLTRR